MKTLRKGIVGIGRLLGQGPEFQQQPEAVTVAFFHPQPLERKLKG
jgi:hypothetical protein